MAVGTVILKDKYLSVATVITAAFGLTTVMLFKSRGE